MKSWPGVIARYRDRLHLPGAIEPVTLLEGDTPLVPLPRLAEEWKAREIWVKVEGLNPTGSFKDRGMTVAVSEAVARGARKIVCASTGNTAASAAAYAARAGIECRVLVPEGKVAGGKLAGALAYGAKVLQIQGSFDEALALVRDLCARRSFALVNSLNPYRLEGQKTAAFEIVEALGRAPDWLALPVGNAGNITAYWRGFRESRGREGGNLPQLLGVQAEGAAPLVLGHPVERPETVASAIRIGKPARGAEALDAARESGGRIVCASDAAILAAQDRLAGEGIWVEPASAAPIAGIAREVERGRLDLRGLTVVCVATGHGLKDAAAIVDRKATGTDTLPARPDAIEAWMEER